MVFSFIELKSSFGLDHIIQAKRHFKIIYFFHLLFCCVCLFWFLYHKHVHTVCNVALIHRHQIKYTSPIVKLISIQIQISMVSLVFQIDSVHAFSIYVSMFFGNVSIKEHLEPFLYQT